METFSELVEAWGQKALAADLGIPPERVRGWRRFNTIPAEYWQGLLSKAPDRGICVSPELLIDLAARD